MSAATWLFVPGSRPDRFAKAAASGADEVICDLEDAVAPGEKEQARADVVAWLRGGGSAWVRLNAVGTRWHDDDVAALAECAGLRGLVVPKAESPSALAALAAEVPGPDRLVALVESAIGVLRAADLAACPGVGRLAFGSIDFALDVDATEDDDSLLLARSTLVLASRAGGRAAPLDGVTTALDDPEALAADARRARRLGFGGKLCVSPRQVPVVAAQFRPSDLEVDWARRVVAAADGGTGVVATAGEMVDRPVLERAQRILAAASGGRA